ncbi:uncharacterized protein LOC116253614 isoform X4 [Nymphaea colorata]|uniref:uncharacterized protein LOC116253614 isoform X4 n=1 Tax=Nymphaea colorata TaxID=210225 RepID=UPI00129DEEA6|nr:uncharacterized protein LOC116253614 isoform X4 [Nymphaea colorata]
MKRGVQRWAVNIARWDPSEAQLLFCIFLLPPHERPPITKFLNVEDKKRAVVSRMLQYMLVHEVLGIPFKEITIGRTIEGKPYLCLVGVDVVSLEVPKKENAVEFIKHFSSYFATSEWNNIISSGTSIDILVEFHRYWCLKEAFTKAIGVGLGYSIGRLEFHHTNWNDIRVQVDGEDSDDCRFWLSELGKQNWVGQLHLQYLLKKVCVARCHPKRAVQSYKRTLWRVDFDEEEHNRALLLPNREFLLLQVEDLIPKHEKEAYESLRKKCSAAYVRSLLKVIRKLATL